MNSNISPRRPVVRRMVVGLAAAALAVSACGGSDDSDSSGASTESTSDASGTAEGTTTAEGDGTAGAQALQQNRPVTVDGDGLATFDAETPEDPSVGATAPVIAGETFDGTPITVGGSTESPTLVVFLAHWCPHCNDEVPELIELAEAGDLPEGLDVVGVSTAVDPAGPNYPPSEWAEETNWPWPMMADDAELSAITALGGSAFPFAVVLDSDGTVLARRAGGAPAAETRAFLDDALANRASST